MSEITLVGNLTRDWELKFLADGTAVADCGIAVTARKYNRDAGAWEDGETSFYNLSVWRQLAENVAESLHKGDQVVLKGNLQIREFVRDDETKGKSADITVTAIGASCQFATVTVHKAKRSTAPAAGMEEF